MDPNSTFKIFIQEKKASAAIFGDTTVLSNLKTLLFPRIGCHIKTNFYFYRQAFDLLEFDIQELEESLLLMGTEDDTTKLVLRLLIKLLRGCSKSFTSNINEDVRKSFRLPPKPVVGIPTYIGDLKSDHFKSVNI